MTSKLDRAEPVVILLAEDDPDDQMLVREALHEARVINTLEVVSDGEELLDYLHRRGKYAAPHPAPRPSIILIDLNMPRKDGREALREIKNDPDLRAIPAVILTTSRAEEDIFRSYDSGANSYISKPVTFEGLVAVMKAMGEYWLQFVELPPSHD